VIKSRKVIWAGHAEHPEITRRKEMGGTYSTPRSYEKERDHLGNLDFFGGS
jgi:hypothetical protein